MIQTPGAYLLHSVSGKSGQLQCDLGSLGNEQRALDPHVAVIEFCAARLPTLKQRAALVRGDRLHCDKGVQARQTGILHYAAVNLELSVRSLIRPCRVAPLISLGESGEAVGS
jgi:hypothetical protein